MNSFKRFLVQVPWSLLLPFEGIACLLFLTGHADLWAVATFVGFFVAAWFNGNTAQMKETRAWIAKSMAKDIELAQLAAETASMYRRLYHRHFMMTGEHFDPRVDAETDKIHQA